MLNLMTDKHLDMVLKWRNLPEVRQTMFTQHEISPSEHKSWWTKVKQDNKKCWLVYSFDSVEVGVVNFYDIDDHYKSCYWGFYLGENKLFKKFSKLEAWLQLESEAIQYAFNELKCHRLFCETFKFNRGVLQMHMRFGFKTISVETRQKNAVPEDVVVAMLENPIKDIVTIDTQNTSNEIHSENALKVAFAGSANLDFVADCFKKKSQCSGLDVELIGIPFGQYRMLLSDSNSRLHSNPADYWVFIERVEDLFGAFSVLNPSVYDEIERRWIEFLDIIRQARSSFHKVFFIANLSPVSSFPISILPNATDRETMNDMICGLNRELQKLCDELPDTYILDMKNLIRQCGQSVVHPHKYWYLARVPFSESFNQILANSLIGMILALRGKNIRVAVLDLDNTLWGGVIGDDGISGIQIGGDYPGNVYLTIQSIFKVLKQRGIMLAICSKNTEKIATEAFERIPDMILKLDDFVAKRINWQPKYQNIHEIADELNLGMSSFCFFDDNPAERNEVRNAIPEIIVPDLPKEISEWPEYILKIPGFTTLSMTTEDAERTKKYHIRSEIKQQEKKFSDRVSFLRSLEMRISFSSYDELNKKRVLQLINKTNQFNLTTKRYSEQELTSVLKHGECVAIALGDCYVDDEIIGVMVFEHGDDIAFIDNFLLSCRILGKGVETAALSFATQRMKVKGYKFLVGRMTPTERNQPAQKVYENHGFFRIKNESDFEFSLESGSVSMPDWFDVNNKMD